MKRLHFREGKWDETHDSAGDMIDVMRKDDELMRKDDERKKMREFKR